MKKIININLSSRLIPIEDSAYEQLRNYLESLKRYFAREEGGDEIVADIENRIAELFQDKLKKGAHCITDDDVNAMMQTMGRPEQLDEETVAEPQEKKGSADTLPPPAGRLLRDENDKVLGGVCAGLAAYFKIDPAVVRVLTFLLCFAWGVGVLVYIVLWIVLPSSRVLKNPVRKRLYRNPDNKVLGGVCSGMAAYFNTDPVVPRIFFALPVLGLVFSSIFHHGISGFFFPLSLGSLPTLVVLYIILWVSVPKAMTVTERLEMRGERVDLQNITEALKGAQDEKKNEPVHAPEPLKGFSAGPTPVITPPPAYQGRRRSSLGYLVVTLLKILAFILLAVVCISVCIALLSVAGGLMGAATFSSMMLPFKGLVLHTSLQHFLAWPAILLTVGVPIAGLIWLIIKLVTGFRPRTRYVGLSLFLLWVIGLICAVWLCADVAGDFRTSFRESSNVSISQPPGRRLIIARTPTNIHIGSWTVIDDLIELREDTLVLKTVRLDIEKSRDDSFRVELARASNGPTVALARTYTRAIGYPLEQRDSMLYIPDGFSLPKGMPFRNQRLILRIYVPAGASIRVEESLRHVRRHWNGDWDDWDDADDWDRRHGESWAHGYDYLMTPEGLRTPQQLKEQQEEQRAKDSLAAPPPPPEAPAPPKKKTDSTGYHYPGSGRNA